MKYRTSDAGNLASPLPGHLVRRNAAAAGTGHNLRCGVPSVVDEAVNVLEETDGALAFQAFFDRAGNGSPDPTIRRFGRLSIRDTILPPLREWQDDERPQGIH